MARTTRKTSKAKKAKKANLTTRRLKISLDHPRVLIKRAWSEAKNMRHRSSPYIMNYVAEDGWLAVNLIADAAADALGHAPGGGGDVHVLVLEELERVVGLKPNSLVPLFCQAGESLQRFVGRGFRLLPGGRS